MDAVRMRAFTLRARLYALIRDFMQKRDVLEVDTPILSASGNTEPNIDGFVTHFTGHVDAGAAERYLRTSPEYPLKRLLAEGLGDCYELGRVFRNGEAGRQHNPEFSMLEWYRLGMDHYTLAQETVLLVQAALQLCERTATVTCTSYRELFLQHLQLDPFTASVDALREPLTPYAIDPEGLSRDDWLDLLLTHRIQPAFEAHAITVIHDWPPSQAALARIRPDTPPVAERFELYLGPYELANGYHELNHAEQQRQRFVAENQRRQQQGKPVLPLDENLLASLDDLPACAGVALGIERLLMCLLQTDDIAAVMSFTFARA